MYCPVCEMVYMKDPLLSIELSHSVFCITKTGMYCWVCEMVYMKDPLLSIEMFVISLYI